jgi:stringent starvation protein B
MDDRTPEKKERLLAALARGKVMVHLDARRAGVRVPPELKTESHLRLNLSYRFDPSDLSVSEAGVHCTLSFSGTRFTVAIPWNAIFAITSQSSGERDFWMFPEDMPPELTQSAATARPRPVLAASRSGPLLREVPVEGSNGEVSGSGEGRPRGRGHLRVVK